MKKLILRGVIVIALLLIVGVVALYFSLNGFIKRVVESQGSSATGVATTLGGVNLSPFGGELALSDFDLGNPEGFSSENLFSLGKADVKVQLGSLTGDKIVVDRLHLDGAQVVVAFENGKLNVQELLKQIQDKAGPAEDKPAEDAPAEDAPAEEGGGKSVRIEDMKITNTIVRGEISLIPGTPPVPLDFKIADIEEQGFEKADTGAVIGYVMETIMLNVGEGLAKNVEGLGDVVGDFGELGVQAVEDLGGEAEKALDGGIKSIEEGLGLSLIHI